MSGRITYTKDQITSLNTHYLKKIPELERFASLYKFVSDERNINLSSVVKQPQIPTYLKNRYGDIAVSRGNFRDSREATARHKLYVPKTETIADRINEEIRDLLSKISENNKEKLMGSFMSKEIPTECGQTLIDNIYLFATDLTYLIPLYVEIIFGLKVKNSTLYDQLINKIIKTASDPFPIEDPMIKRLRLGNILLIAEIYLKNQSIINTEMIIKMATFLFGQVSTKQPDYLQMICALLKHVNQEPSMINAVRDAIMPQIRQIAENREYDRRYRFMMDDLIETYNTEEDDE